jgi:hypothetical protein
VVGGDFDYLGVMGMAMNLAIQAGITAANAGSTRLWNAMIAGVPGASGFVPIPAKYCIAGPVT